MVKKIFLLISILMIASLMLSACGGPSETPTPEPPAPEPTDAPAPPTDEPVDTGPPDLTGEVITIYHFGDLSGPYASITGPLVNGATDMVAYLNEQGGIFGATIEMQFADTGGDVAEAVAIYDRFTTDDDNIIMFIMYGSPEEEALYERLAEDQIPVIAAGLSTVAFYGIPDGYIFGQAATYPDQFGYFLDYVVANWDSLKPEGAGDDINVAYISWPTAYGQGALTDESRAYAESLGVSIVAEEVFDVAPGADTTTAILNAEAAGANLIYTNTLAFGPASILNDLNALGLRGSFFVGGNNWAMDVSTYAFLADPAYAVGFCAPFPFAWWHDGRDNPAIDLAWNLFEANERTPGEQNVGRLLLMGGVDLAKFAIENAILEVGFENLTGEAVYNAMTKIKDYNVLNGLAVADFTGGRRSPNLLQFRCIEGGPDAFTIKQDFTEAPELRP